MHHLFILLLGAMTALAQNRQMTTMATAEEQSINNLGEKPPLELDPKLRKTLLRVLTKLQAGRVQLSDQAQSDITDEEFLRLVGQKVSAEDLGSVEASKEISEPINRKIGQQSDRYFGPEFNYLPPPTEPAATPEAQPMELGKFPSTSPTPADQQSIFDRYPAPIDAPQTEDKIDDEAPATAPDEQTEEAEEPEEADEMTEEENKDNSTITRTIVDSSSSISEVIDDSGTANKTENKNQKHEVEFLHSSLVAAFTVQQDDRGIPRKVIPLDYRKPGFPAQNFNTLPQPQKQLGLAEKEALLERELRLLRQQQEVQERELNRLRADTRRQLFPGPQPPTNFNEGGFVPIFGQQRTVQAAEEARRQQQAILFGQQRQFEIQRQEEIQKQTELYRQRELEKQRFELERQRYLDRQQREQNQRQIDLQRSIVYQIEAARPQSSRGLPEELTPPLHSSPFDQYRSRSIELNRVNRQESQSLVGNWGFNRVQTPPSPDLQLQSLLAQSGVANPLDPSAGEDLSIVSKVLALNHGNPLQQNPRFPSNYRTDLFARSSDNLRVFAAPPQTVPALH